MARRPLDSTASTPLLSSRYATNHAFTQRKDMILTLALQMYYAPGPPAPPPQQKKDRGCLAAW